MRSQLNLQAIFLLIYDIFIFFPLVSSYLFYNYCFFLFVNNLFYSLFY